MEGLGMEVILGVLSALAGVVTGFVKAFKWVQEGQRGVKLRFGKFVREVDPGFVFLIPFMEELVRIHVRITTSAVPPQEITLKDKLTFRVSAVVVFRINEVRQALFNVHDVGVAINDIAGSLLRRKLQQCSYDEATNFDEVAADLLKMLQEETSEWGVSFLRFAVTDFAPIGQTASVLLHVARVEQQIKGNELLIKHLEKNARNLKALKQDTGSDTLLAALTMRGAPSLVSVNGAASDPSPVAAQQLPTPASGEGDAEDE